MKLSVRFIYWHESLARSCSLVRHAISLVSSRIRLATFSSHGSGGECWAWGRADAHVGRSARSFVIGNTMMTGRGGRSMIHVVQFISIVVRRIQFG